MRRIRSHVAGTLLALVLALLLATLPAVDRGFAGTGASLTPEARETHTAVPSSATEPATTLEPIAPSTEFVPPVPEQVVLNLRIDAAEADFGRVTASGEIDPTVRGLTSTTDEAGAVYVKLNAVRLTVESDTPWSGSCTAAPRPSDAGTTAAALANARLEWRLIGAEVWSPVPPAGASDIENVCFPVRSVGDRVYVYDLRLRVESSDAPGTFAAAITFTVWPSASP